MRKSVLRHIVFLLLPVSISILLGEKAYADYEKTPVILQLNREKQHDSVGFNLVEEIPKMLMKRIKNGDVLLWDSPAEKHRISYLALKKIEETNEVKFTDLENLFIYQLWELNRNKFHVETFGFSFYHRKPDGKIVNFGFLKLEELSAVFKALIIPSGINGSSNLTYYNAVQSLSYPFNVVRFGRVDLAKNPQKALDLKKEVLENPKLKSNIPYIAEAKDVLYFVLPGISDNTPNKKLVESFNAYYQRNPHEFFNQALSVKHSHLEKNLVLQVTRIEVEETWVKENGKISYFPKRIKLFINDVPLKPMSMSELGELGIVVDFRPLEEFIKTKSFRYTLMQVNNTRVKGYETKQVQEKLVQGDWNNLK
jgi:hypothetical protein